VKAYYHARAPEYDDWWLGRGAFAGRDRPGFDDELMELTELLRALPPARTLDVACGTGFLTRHLRGEVVGIDQSDVMIEIARRQAPNAIFAVADALELPFADRSFDRVFASYFYCHLVEEERERFLSEARRVAGELIVVGSRRRNGDASERWEERRVRDGRSWVVFKRVFEPELLAAELSGEPIHAGRWFVAVRAYVE
jgi:demethylmenaquinone methyltransferase/2-methoxy-6-polyprenyl-1,4-benzoquinol methylase